MAVPDDLRAVNAAFYRAFRERDMVAMQRLWATEIPVACVHPGMSVVHGRDDVLRSWKGILQHPRAPVLHETQVEVHVLGTSAFITCLEGREGEKPKLVATNVFTMEEGRWRLVHHHSAPLAARAVGPKAEPEDPFRLN